jgi:hypothetical protein
MCRRRTFVQVRESLAEADPEQSLGLVPRAAPQIRNNDGNTGKLIRPGGTVADSGEYRRE